MAGVEIGRAGARRRRSIRRGAVGYVFQRPSDNLLGHLTVAQHLRLASRSGSLDADVMATVEALGIGHRLEHRPVALSGGEQQRAAVAQALASGATIVVADEPTAELDSDAAAAVLGRIAELATRGITFILATHDRSVMEIADHRLTLHHGVVADAGTSARVEVDEAEVVPLRWPPDDGAWLDGDEPPVARLDAVTKRYGAGGSTVQALDSVTLDVAPGSIVGLVGRSGSGKTTLLNVAAGWDAPDGGTVERPGGEDPNWADVAVVPQHLGLMDELTVRENVEYPARLQGDLPRRRRLVDDLLERLGLARLQHRPPTETSLGEQQRTAVARAVVLRPALIVADEPTAHQDAGWAAAVLATLGDAVVAGSGCIVATHDPDVLASVDRVVRIADGRLEDPRPGPS